MIAAPDANAAAANVAFTFAAAAAAAGWHCVAAERAQSGDTAGAFYGARKLIDSPSAVHPRRAEHSSSPRWILRQATHLLLGL
jgi:hypothetical protein